MWSARSESIPRISRFGFRFIAELFPPCAVPAFAARANAKRGASRRASRALGLVVRPFGAEAGRGIRETQPYRHEIRTRAEEHLLVMWQSLLLTGAGGMRARARLWLALSGRFRSSWPGLGGRSHGARDMRASAAAPTRGSSDSFGCRPPHPGRQPPPGGGC